MNAKTKYFLVDVILIAAIIAFIGVIAFFLTGCAGSGPNGAWTTDDFAAVNRGVSDAVSTYERARYPDRPVYPPGAPFPVYPTSP